MYYIFYPFLFIIAIHTPHTHSMFAKEDASEEVKELYVKMIPSDYNEICYDHDGVLLSTEQIITTHDDPEFSCLFPLELDTVKSLLNSDTETVKKHRCNGTLYILNIRRSNDPREVDRQRKILARSETHFINNGRYNADHEQNLIDTRILKRLPDDSLTHGPLGLGKITIFNDKIRNNADLRTKVMLLSFFIPEKLKQ